MYRCGIIKYAIKVMHYDRLINRYIQYSIIGVLGLWSSPSMKGSRPPPCSNFTLTVTDEDQAVMFGGYTLSGESSEAYILHLPTMVSYF